MNEIFIIGYFGYNTNQLDGQTVKTRDMRRLAEEQLVGNVQYYDTEDFQYNKLSIFRMFRGLLRCRILLYLPAHNNLRYIFPIVFLLSVVLRFDIHYFVVGGWLREFISSLSLHRFMMKRIKGIHVETNCLKKELEIYYKFTNVDIFPNFRFFNYIPELSSSDKLRLVFMARISKKKGIDWIFALADYIVKNDMQDRFTITFYGPINDDKEYFQQCVSQYPFVEYCGVLQPEIIYETLSDYDVLLLPTHYYTEGLPGSIVDAYIAGIPVIVTEWKYAREFIEDGDDGYIIPFENGESILINRVLELEKNRNTLYGMRKNVMLKRMEFAPPDLMSIL